MHNDSTGQAGITAIILAGGLARRMGGQDKGLVPLAGRPLIRHAIDAIAPQVDQILISANRNIQAYRNFGYPVVEDGLEGHLGPLAGLARGIQASSNDHVLAVPCDAPFIPAGLAGRLCTAMNANGADVAVARDSARIQPMFALVKRATLANLQSYLREGGRKAADWYARQLLVEVDFSDVPDAFINLNSLVEIEAIEAKIESDRHRT